MTDVKICGLSTPETVDAAIDAGAKYLGFVFHKPSPRYVPIDAAAWLVGRIPHELYPVGLFVDPDDGTLLDAIGAMNLDLIQLHGNESASRIREIQRLTHIPVMKAIRVASDDDLLYMDGYEETADWLLFDSKPQGATLPGGTGQTFDWDILAQRTFTKPWMLSGGLTAENVAEALSILSPAVVDVSSGVESAPGVKDIAKIKAFIQAVKTA